MCASSQPVAEHGIAGRDRDHLVRQRADPRSASDLMTPTRAANVLLTVWLTDDLVALIDTYDGARRTPGRKPKGSALET